MAKISDYEVLGKSGTKYTFAMYEYPGKWKPVAAVYIITKRTTDGAGKGIHSHIYVGETADLSERHEDHHKQECFKRHAANCIGVLVTNDEQRRLQIETDIRNKDSSWRCNSQ